MAVTKRILCLANSRKPYGRCVAGVELASDGKPLGWIRPIGNREHNAVSEYERQYKDGSDPKVLDVIDVPLLEPRPNGCQQENWLLDPDYYWILQRKASLEELAPLTTEMPTLWANNIHTYNGMNDELPLEVANALNSSLCMIHVGGIKLCVYAPGQSFNNPKRRVQGWFHYRDVEYRLWVTDPIIERSFLANEDGSYHLGECFLTISIGEPDTRKNASYKLIAAIIMKS